MRNIRKIRKVRKIRKIRSWLQPWQGGGNPHLRPWAHGLLLFIITGYWIFDDRNIRSWIQPWQGRVPYSIPLAFALIKNATSHDHLQKEFEKGRTCSDHGAGAVWEPALLEKSSTSVSHHGSGSPPSLPRLDLGSDFSNFSNFYNFSSDSFFIFSYLLILAIVFVLFWEVFRGWN